jgi:hypothetical protein
MGNVTTLKFNTPYGQAPLVGRYRLKDTGLRYKMFCEYGKFIVVEFDSDDNANEYIYDDAVEAGVIQWIQLIAAIIEGNVEDLHLTPDGFYRLTCISVMSSTMFSNRVEHAA